MKEDESLLSKKKLCDKESGNDKKEIDDDEDVFCDAQCNFIKSVNIEIDPVSDEEEFWDAQSGFEGHDDSTFKSGTNEESSINVFSDKSVEDKKEDDSPSPDYEQYYSVSNCPDPDQYHCKDSRKKMHKKKLDNIVRHKPHYKESDQKTHDDDSRIESICKLDNDKKVIIEPVTGYLRSRQSGTDNNSQQNKYNGSRDQ